jgi:hypothetical protein
MALRSVKTLDTFHFTDLESLREWLNQFETTDLSAVNAETIDNGNVRLEWQEETLSDGSKVINAVFS